MSELTQPNTREQNPQNKKGKRTLLLILLVSVLPVAAAYLAFFTGIGVPSHTVNHGALLPEPLNTKEILSASTWERISQDKKWRLFIPVTLPCEQGCQDNLYVTRQVHTRLGEKAPRLERYLINLSGSEGEQYFQQLQKDHPLLQLESVEPATWASWVAQSPFLQNQEPRPWYLLVDQEGVAMMLYRDQHGNDLLADIKRALKYSIDYSR